VTGDALKDIFESSTLLRGQDARSLLAQGAYEKLAQLWVESDQFSFTTDKKRDCDDDKDSDKDSDTDDRDIDDIADFLKDLAKELGLKDGQDGAPIAAPPVLGPIVIKGSGGNDQLTLAEWGTKTVNGKAGTDTLRLGADLWESDLRAEGNALILTDRVSGAETKIKNVEVLEIGGQAFSFDALHQQLSTAPHALMLADGLARIKLNTPDPTPSVLWDQVVQSLVAETMPGPTNAARIYAMLHTAIYDAYAAHDANALRVSLDLEGDNIEFNNASADKVEEAMHYAGYTLLSALFPQKAGVLDQIMEQRLGLDPQTSKKLAAQIGQDAAHDVLVPRLQEIDQLPNSTAAQYTPKNPNPDTVNAIDLWTPEYIKGSNQQKLQKFLSPEFATVEPFALPQGSDGTTDFSTIRPVAPQPFFMDGFADTQLDIARGTVTLARAATVNGTDYPAGAEIAVTPDLVGTLINPGFIAQAQHLIDISAGLDTNGRSVAEFWEDGPGTSYPPGTMMTFAQFVSARDGLDTGASATLFLAMGNAMMDAAIAAWDAKVYYDYARPVQAIHDLGRLGLIGTPGTDELTGETGQVITAFGGYDPETGASLGTRTILAENFVTYQNPKGDFSPPFAEYVSGHSTFSGAAAAVLEAFTGSQTLGAATIIAPNGSQFDPTFPDQSLNFSWDTLDIMAQQAGASRIFGGIHFTDGNTAGLTLGDSVGLLAAELAQQFSQGQTTEQDSPFFEWMLA
jgi:hypothetical protein